MFKFLFWKVMQISAYLIRLFLACFFIHNISEKESIVIFINLKNVPCSPFVLSYLIKSVRN